MDEPAQAPQRPPEVPSQYRHERIHDPPVPGGPVQETAPPHPAAPLRDGILDWLSLTVWDVVTRLIAWSKPTVATPGPQRGMPRWLKIVVVTLAISSLIAVIAEPQTAEMFWGTFGLAAVCLLPVAFFVVDGIVPWLIKRGTVMLRRPVIRFGGLGLAIALSTLFRNFGDVFQSCGICSRPSSGGARRVRYHRAYETEY